MIVAILRLRIQETIREGNQKLLNNKEKCMRNFETNKSKRRQMMNASVPLQTILKHFIQNL